MVDPRKLAMYLGQGAPSPEPDPHTLPTKIEAGYVPPNPDGTSKNCKNCWKWIQGKTACLELGDAVVEQDMVCTLHSYGQPRHEDVPPTSGHLQPSDVGLEEVPLGTSCITCASFDSGFCRAVQDEGAYAVVEPLACCNRWGPRG